TQISSLVDTKVCSYRHAAVLLRSIKTSGAPIIGALKARDIPYIVGGNLGLFGRDEAIAVGAIFVWLGGLSWRKSPWDNGEVPNEDLLSFASHHWPSPISGELLADWRAQVIRTRRPPFRNLAAAFHDLLRRLGVDQWDPDLKENAVRLANLGRFNGLLDDFEAARRRGGRPFNSSQDLKNLAWFIKTQGLSGYDEQAIGVPGDVDAVQVLTIHQAKGLEWPVVFVPALVEGRFPGRRVRTQASTWVPPNLYDAPRYAGSVDDERKVFYVATTRARDALALTRFSRMKNVRRPSIFLVELQMPVSPPPPAPFVGAVERKESPDDEVVAFTPGEIIDYRRCPHKY
ncbi:MAG: 3'-5' exonuclease, partial [Nitrososphaerales archaeon]